MGMCPELSQRAGGGKSVCVLWDDLGNGWNLEGKERLDPAVPPLHPNECPSKPSAPHFDAPIVLGAAPSLLSCKE